MPVYSDRVMEPMRHSLEAIAANFFSRILLVLDHDEFIRAFINPDHVDALRRTEELAGFIGPDYFSCAIDSLRIMVRFTGHPPIIIPRYVGEGLQPTCPDHIEEKIHNWVRDRVRLGEVFGDAKDALEHLNEVCPDVATLNMLLPCTSFIMASVTDDKDSIFHKRAQKMENNKNANRIPKLSRAIKDRLVDVSAIVQSVSLLSDAPAPSAPRKSAIITSPPYIKRISPNMFDEQKAGSFL